MQPAGLGVVTEPCERSANTLRPEPQLDNPETVRKARLQAAQMIQMFAAGGQLELELARLEREGTGKVLLKHLVPGAASRKQRNGALRCRLDQSVGHRYTFIVILSCAMRRQSWRWAQENIRATGLRHARRK